MTATPTRPATTAPLTAHPLSLLTAEEVSTNRDVVAEAGLLGPDTRFVYVGLLEAPKAELLAHVDGADFRRSVASILIDRATGAATSVVVDVTTGAVESTREIDALAEGQGPILDEEFEDIEQILLDSPEWLAAMEKRGIDPAKVRAVPLSAGNFGDPVE